MNVAFNLRLVRAEDVGARLRVALEFDRLQASCFALFGEGRVGLLRLCVDGVDFLPEVVVVLKSVNHAINSTLSLLDEPVIMLVRLD